ncbi:Lactonase, 7-bladed beta-propeller-domain-containing protein [Armillaria nabsnona]|nr:Lactonase, 7-bladed beta-propeller-domain-containing protein [Armillaria nabsnona]
MYLKRPTHHSKYGRQPGPYGVRYGYRLVTDGVEGAVGPLPPDPQFVLSAIIDGALDISSKVYGTPLEAYSYSRNEVISLVDPTLQEDEVDQAGRCLYSSCRLLYKGCTSPIVLKEGELPPPSIAAFFALAHFCDRANVSPLLFDKVGRGRIIDSRISTVDIHILSGSFTSFSLFPLAFSPFNGSLRLLRTVPVVGPHQYIAQTPQAVYATTWATPLGLHGVDSSFAKFTTDGNYGFVPVLGTEEIHIFKRGTNGTLERVAKAKGHAEDGPRHVKVHPNRKVVYCVTEHSNKLDVYAFNTTPTPSLKLVSSQPLYASGSAHSYRGDTLLLAPSSNQIFTTTRGETHLEPGYISVFSLSSECPNSDSSSTVDQESLSVPAESVWIVLTDDDPCTQTPEPYASVRILEWDGWGTGGIREVASYAGTEMQGWSHAVFLHVHAAVEEVV